MMILRGLVLLVVALISLGQDAAAFSPAVFSPVRASLLNVQLEFSDFAKRIPFLHFDMDMDDAGDIMDTAGDVLEAAGVAVGTVNPAGGVALNALGNVMDAVETLDTVSDLMESNSEGTANSLLNSGDPGLWLIGVSLVVLGAVIYYSDYFSPFRIQKTTSIGKDIDNIDVNLQLQKTTSIGEDHTYVPISPPPSLTGVAQQQNLLLQRQLNDKVAELTKLQHDLKESTSNLLKAQTLCQETEAQLVAVKRANSGLWNKYRAVQETQSELQEQLQHAQSELELLQETSQAELKAMAEANLQLEDKYEWEQTEQKAKIYQLEQTQEYLHHQLARAKRGLPIVEMEEDYLKRRGRRKKRFSRIVNQFKKVKRFLRKKEKGNKHANY